MRPWELIRKERWHHSDVFVCQVNKGSILLVLCQFYISHSHWSGGASVENWSIRYLAKLTTPWWENHQKVIGSSAVSWRTHLWTVLAVFSDQNECFPNQGQEQNACTHCLNSSLPYSGVIKRGDQSKSPHQLILHVKCTEKFSSCQRVLK